MQYTLERWSGDAEQWPIQMRVRARVRLTILTYLRVHYQL